MCLQAPDRHTFLRISANDAFIVAVSATSTRSRDARNDTGFDDNQRFDGRRGATRAADRIRERTSTPSPRNVRSPIRSVALVGLLWQADPSNRSTASSVQPPLLRFSVLNRSLRPLCSLGALMLVITSAAFPRCRVMPAFCRACRRNSRISCRSRSDSVLILM